jgi:aspartyl-tRNA(Asn)/glutamyl-tRNA(Gln) amidotransferase subunit C
MIVDNNTINRLANLAKLQFDEVEMKSITNELEKIVLMCEQLKNVDTDGVEPLIYMTNAHNVLRDDVVSQEINHEDALKNAPKRDSDFFRVPKVIESNE